MAYVKKNAETENVETTDEVVAEQKVKTSEHPVDQSDEIAALKAQIEMLTKMMAAGIGAQAPAPAQSSSLLEEVKVVHLRECLPGTTTHIHLSNRDLDFSSFGATLTLDRRQAEELAGGPCRKFFDRGVLAFGEGGEELSRTLGVKSMKDYTFMGSDFVQRLGEMNIYELEDIYNKLCDGLRGFIIEYFKRKIIEKDPKFNDVYKIELLNRLSNGAMSDVILDRQRDSVNEAAKKSTNK